VAFRRPEKARKEFGRLQKPRSREFLGESSQEQMVPQLSSSASLAGILYVLLL